MYRQQIGCIFSGNFGEGHLVYIWLDMGTFFIRSPMVTGDASRFSSGADGSCREGRPVLKTSPGWGFIGDTIAVYEFFSEKVSLKYEEYTPVSCNPCLSSVRSRPYDTAGIITGYASSFLAGR